MAPRSKRPSLDSGHAGELGPPRTWEPESAQLRQLVELSSRLLSTEHAQIDAAVREGIGLLGELAGADCTTLMLLDPRAGGVGRRWAWTRAAARSRPPDSDPQVARRLRHLGRALRRGEVLAVRRLDDLPPEATPERADLEARRIGASLTLPVTQGATTLGYLLCEWETEQPGWSQQQIAFLRMSASVMASGLERARSEAELARQLRLEQGVATLSRLLVAAEGPELERRIPQGLSQLLRITGAERAYLAGFERRSGAVEALYETAVEGLEIETGVRRHWLETPLPFSRSLALAGRDFRFPSLDGLPPEAEGERARLAAAKVRSILGVPLSTRGSMMGYLGLETVTHERDWCGPELDQIRVLAEILTGAMRRHHAEGRLARQVRGERRLARLAQRFLLLDAGDAEDAVRHALEEAACLADAELAALVCLARRGQPRALVQWHLSDARPLALGPPSWIQERLETGALVQIADVAQLGDELAGLRHQLESLGCRSVLALPVETSGERAGFLVFHRTREARGWDESEITRLRLFGEILISALGRRQIEEALDDSRRQLLQAQKMEAVGRLAGGIAHDFNNLLTVILGFSRALLGEAELDQSARQDLVEVHDAAERAAALTRQLLTFSRRQSVEPRRVDLNASAAGMQEMLHRLLGEDVELSIETREPACWVEADPSHLEQVLVNLAVNARDAMPDGGQLRIHTCARSLDEQERERLGLPRAGSYVLLSVSDSGSGMDEQVRARIFDPFFTTKEPGRGTGLGLSIVYSVVEQAGGAIRALGEPGKGTTFEIHWPAVAEIEAANEARPAPGPSPGRAYRVLLVEDDSSVRRLARRILERAGHEVLEAVDGADALERISARSDQIDLLIADVVMPRMGGVELARRLAERNPGTALLLVSGYPQDHERSRLASPDEGCFLYKPFTARSLLEAVHARVERCAEAAPER